MGATGCTVLDHLVAIRGPLEDCGVRFSDTIKRTGNLENQMIGLSKCLDSIDGRLDRIVRRLGAVEVRL
jgi:hypothetical protein